MVSSRASAGPCGRPRIGVCTSLGTPISWQRQWWATGHDVVSHDGAGMGAVLPGARWPGTGQRGVVAENPPGRGRSNLGDRLMPSR